MKENLSHVRCVRYSGSCLRWFGWVTFALVNIALPLPQARAVDYLWQTAGTTNGWSTAAGDTNWFVGAGSVLSTWVDGNAAVFNATTDTTVTITGTVQPSAITFGSGWANGFTITGGTIAFGSSLGVIDSSAVGTTGSRVIAINSNLTGSGGLTINANGDLTASGGGNSARFALGGDNSGLTGGIAITGGLVDGGLNTSFGADTITLSNGGGILDANHSLTLVNNIVVTSTGGTIRTYGNATTTLNGAISGTGALNHTDTGRLALAGDLSAYTGTFSNLAGNTVIDTNSSLKGAVVISAGSLAVGNNGTKGSLKDATSISIANGTSLYIRRTDEVNASAILPGVITFLGATSNFEFNPTAATGVLNLDMDLGSDVSLGQVRISGGTVNLLSGTDVVASIISIGLQSATNRGTLNIGAGSTVTTRFFNVGADGSNTGTVNQTGGTVTVVAGGSGFRVGHWSSGTNPANLYTLSGGVLDATALVANSGSDRFVNIGWDGAATMVVGGGSGSATLKSYGVQLDIRSPDAAINNTLTVLTNGVVEIGAGGTAGGSVNDNIILSGGTLKATDASTWAASIQTAVAATSTLNVNGVNVTLTSSVTGTGTLSLTDSAGGGVLTLNSGTGQQTLSAGLAGSVAITKAGTGVTVLSGTGTYSGILSHTAGTLMVTGGYAAGAFNVADGAVFGGEGTVGSLVLGTTAGATLLVNSSTSGEALSIAGNAVFNGPATVDFAVAPTAVGQPIRLFTYGGTLTGFGNLFMAGGNDKYRTAVFSNSAGVVSVDIGNKNLVWNGTSGGQWQVGGVNRWNTGESDAFYWGDNLRFDDTGVTTGITLTGELRPASVVVDSDINNYTFTGSTGNFIGGNGSLTKSGSSTLTINAPNTYSGGTTISEGTIQISTASSLGSGAVTLGDSNTGSADVALYLDAGRSVFANAVIVSASGTGTVTLGSRSTVTGSGANNYFNNIVLNRDVIFDSNAADRTDYRNISGTGNVTVKGTQRSVFFTANTFVGNLTVSTTGAGSLQLGANSTAFNAIPDASNVTVSSGAVLNLSYAANGTETINGLFGAGIVGNFGGNANTLIVGGANGDGEFSGIIRNGGVISFAKSGTGNQKLTGTASTYTGVTTVAGGVLEVSLLANGGANSSIGAATNAAANLVLNGGILRYTGGDASTDRLFTLGTAGGGIESSGLGVLTLSSTAAVVVTTSTTGKTFSLGGTNTGNNTFAGVLGDLGTGLTSFNKTGVGTWVMSGLSTYTGVTTISGGVLSVASIGNGGTASNVGQSAKAGSNLVLNGGTLRYAGASITTDRAFQTGTSGGAIEVVDAMAVLQFGSASTPFSLAGTLTKTGAGTLRFVNYSGSTATAATDLIINQGAVEFSTGYFNSSPFGKYGLFITVNSGGILRTTTAHALGGDNIDAGTSLGQIRLMGGTFQVNGTQYISGGLVGTEGRLVMQGGVVEGSADLRAVPAGSTVTSLASNTTSEIRNSGGVNLQYGGLIADVADGGAVVDLWISSVISSTNGLTKSGAGTLQLTGNNTYQGDTAINAGTVLANAQSFNSSATGSGAVHVAANATLGGSGSVIAGVDKSIIIDGTFMVGNIGDTIDTADRDFEIGVSGTGSILFNGILKMDIFGQNDALVGEENSTYYNDVLYINSGGTTTLGGRLVLTDVSGESSTWVEGDSWKLIDWVNVSGTGDFTYGANDLPTLAAGLKWDTSQLASTGYISVVQVPEPSRAILLLVALFGIAGRRRR